jgi:hypothetical protein
MIKSAMAARKDMFTRSESKAYILPPTQGSAFPDYVNPSLKRHFATEPQLHPADSNIAAGIAKPGENNVPQKTQANRSYNITGYSQCFHFSSLDYSATSGFFPLNANPGSTRLL